MRGKLSGQKCYAVIIQKLLGVYSSNDTHLKAKMANFMMRMVLFMYI